MHHHYYPEIIKLMLATLLVKQNPYRTKIREYVLNYNKTDPI